MSLVETNFLDKAACSTFVLRFFCVNRQGETGNGGIVVAFLVKGTSVGRKEVEVRGHLVAQRRPVEAIDKLKLSLA